MRQSEYKGGHLLKSLPPRDLDRDTPLSAGTKVTLLDVDSSPDPLTSSGLSESIASGSRLSSLRNIRNRTRSPTPTTENAKGRRKASVEPKASLIPSRSSARIARRNARGSRSEDVYSPDELSAEEEAEKKRVTTRNASVKKMTDNTSTTKRGRTSRQKEGEQDEGGHDEKKFVTSKESPKRQKVETQVLDSSDGSDEDSCFGGSDFPGTRNRKGITTFKGRNARQLASYTASKNSRLGQDNSNNKLATKGGESVQRDHSQEDGKTEKFKDARKAFPLPELKAPEFQDISKKYALPKLKEEKEQQFEDLSKKYPLPKILTKDPPSRPSPEEDKARNSLFNDSNGTTFKLPATFGRTIQIPAPSRKRKGTRSEPSPKFVNAIVKFGGGGLGSPDDLQFAKHCTDSQPESKSPSSQIPEFKCLNALSPASSCTRKSKSPSNMPDLEDITATKQRPPSPSVALDPDTSLTIDSHVCALCCEPLDLDFLSNYNPSGKTLGFRDQLDLCKQHKRLSAEKECQLREYPAQEIDWRKLPKRIERYINDMTQIIESKMDSRYREDLSTDARRTKNSSKKLLETDFENHTPGYYGPKGAHIMMEILMSKLANRIREVGVNDRLIAGGGVSGFVQSVLVPELGVRLVMEDMKVDQEKAKQIIKATAEIGELLNEEDEGFMYDEDDSFWDDEGSGRSSNGSKKIWLKV